MVDNEGDEIFADEIGVMLARDISALHQGSTFVVDVKSGRVCFATDPELRANGAVTDYWKTAIPVFERRVASSRPSPLEVPASFFDPPIGQRL